MNGRGVFVGLMVGLICFGSCAGVNKSELAAYMKISMMVGKVKVRLSGGQFRSARVGMRLHQSDVVKTVGSTSVCDLRTPGGSVVRLDGESVLVMSRLYRDGKIKVEKTGLELLAGRVIVKAKKLFKRETFFIRTKTAIAGVRGTEFVVSIDIKNNTRVGVKSGKVLVSRKLGSAKKAVDTVVKAIAAEKKVLLNPGQQVIIRKKDNDTLTAVADSELLVRKGRNFSLKKVIRKVLLRAARKRVRFIPQRRPFYYLRERGLKRDFEQLQPSKGPGKRSSSSRGIFGRKSSGKKIVPSGAGDERPGSIKKNGESSLTLKQIAKLKRKIRLRRRIRFEAAKRRRAFLRRKKIRNRHKDDEGE